MSDTITNRPQDHTEFGIWPAIPEQDTSSQAVEPVGQGLEPVNHVELRLPVSTTGKDVAAVFRAEKKLREVTRDHAEALHINKVSKRLAKKVIRMANKGVSERWTFLGPLGLPSTRDVDEDVGSMALNAELRRQGYPITAIVTRHYDYDGYDNHHTLEITHIDGVEINNNHDQ